MKTLIIYFSQTGYTRQAAELIRDGIVEVTGQCKLTTMADVDTNKLVDYDLVGLGCPVFYYQEPFNVRDFIDGLPDLKDKHWFVFCSHGSVMGITLNSMSERLQKKGVIVVGYYDMYADATLAFIPYPTLTTGHPDSVDLETAHVFGREIAGRNQRIVAGEKNLIPAPEPVDEEWVQNANFFSREILDQIMPRIQLDRDSCTNCLDCQNNCPVNGIDIEADPPRLQTPCIYCYYCVEVCPVYALDSDWEAMESMNPDHYARLREWLDKAVAKGEFRFLMDPDSLDFDNTLRKQWERQRKGKK